MRDIFDDFTALHSKQTKIRNHNMDLVWLSSKEVPEDHEERQRSSSKPRIGRCNNVPGFPGTKSNPGVDL